MSMKNILDPLETLDDRLNKIARSIVQEALNETGGDIDHTAALLGIRGGAKYLRWALSNRWTGLDLTGSQTRGAEPQMVNELVM